MFGFKTFSEVANNYAGGGKSFKETMLHMENAARKVADAHRHMPIRRSETLPTAQQVNCGQQLDVLLSGNCSDNTVTEGTALVEINAPGTLPPTSSASRHPSCAFWKLAFCVKDAEKQAFALAPSRMVGAGYDLDTGFLFAKHNYSRPAC